MLLKSISYDEHPGSPAEWQLESVHLDKINLVVGKNASGKTRFLNVVSGLAKLIGGELQKVFQSGNYRVSFEGLIGTYEYTLNISGGTVRKEVLTRNGESLIDRGADGSGKIWAEQLKQHIAFEAPGDVIAACVRRDAIQHPFLKDLHDWAAYVRHYPFGTSLGRDRLFLEPDFMQALPDQQKSFDVSAVLQTYKHAFDKFAHDFDKALLRDLASLGYDCTDVGAMSIPLPGAPGGAPAVTLFVRERDIATPVTQLTMSAGMFRALALVIHLNDCVFRKLPCTLLIDDIGEGLDFSRSKSFISLLISRAEDNNMQLIMTTNDRFVMNDVPLKYWAVIQRSGGNVRMINIRNSPKIFTQFEDLGLNNFDFFATGFFDKGLQES